MKFSDLDSYFIYNNFNKRTRVHLTIMTLMNNSSIIWTIMVFIQYKEGNLYQYLRNFFKVSPRMFAQSVWNISKNM